MRPVVIEISPNRRSSTSNNNRRASTVSEPIPLSNRRASTLSGSVSIPRSPSIHTLKTRTPSVPFLLPHSSLSPTASASASAITTAASLKKKSSCVTSATTAALNFLQETKQHLSHYYYATLLYLLVVALLGGATIYSLELNRGAGVSYLSCFYTVASAVTVTGLVALDTSTLSNGSNVVIFVCILLGGTVVGSASMPLMRLWHLHSVLEARRREAGCGKDCVPAGVDKDIWAGRVLLRNSLAVGSRVIIAYWACVQIMVFAILAIYTAQSSGVRTFLASRNVDPLWFSGFHAVSSFNNAGFTLFTDNLTGLHEDRCVLIIISLSIMLGNVGSPLVLRGVLVLLHAAFPRDVRYSFLLRHPRVVFFNVFSAKATRELAVWLLLFTSFQFVSFLATDFRRSYLAGFSASSRVLIGYFTAVSTRTAGFNVVNMIDTNISQQLLCAIMMYLAAMPLVAAQRSSALSKEKAITSTTSAQSEEEDKTLPPLPAQYVNISLSALRRRSSMLSARGDLEDLESLAPDEDAVESKLLKLVQQKNPFLQWVHSVPLLRSFSGEVPLLLLALLLICYADDSVMNQVDAPRHRTIFSVVFELCSAYGTVGLTLDPSSLALSAYYSTFSHLIVIAVMFAGRMRGLPLNSDPTSQLYDDWGVSAPATTYGNNDGGGGQYEYDGSIGQYGAGPSQWVGLSNTSVDKHAFTLMGRSLAKSSKIKRSLTGLFAQQNNNNGADSPLTEITASSGAKTPVAELEEERSASTTSGSGTGAEPVEAVVGGGVGF